jgi:serine/threonine-protein kinase HipA
MRVAAELGIRTHSALPSLVGDVLMVPRFDRIARNGKVERLHQESIASILGLQGFDLRPSLFEVVEAIRGVASDPSTETLEFIKRDVLNLAMRNTDNHARNTAVQTVDGITRLAPLFDFAPMYLAPEGITRSARWYHPESRKELRNWGDIVAQLTLPEQERAHVVEALVRFAEELTALPECMRDVGVDEDIVDFVTPSIEAQRTQLLALR